MCSAALIADCASIGCRRRINPEKNALTDLRKPVLKNAKSARRNPHLQDLPRP
jgi:hypothetical protein